jgi:hypothetical protein
VRTKTSLKVLKKLTKEFAEHNSYNFLIEFAYANSIKNLPDLIDLAGISI